MLNSFIESFALTGLNSRHFKASQGIGYNFVEGRFFHLFTDSRPVEITVHRNGKTPVVVIRGNHIAARRLAWRIFYGEYPTERVRAYRDHDLSILNLYCPNGIKLDRIRQTFQVIMNGKYYGSYHTLDGAIQRRDYVKNQIGVGS